MGKIEAICISRKKGTVKKEVKTAEFRVDYGIVGDAHAGNRHRQISILPRESINTIKKKIPGLMNGAFAENIVVKGIDFSEVELGNCFVLGEGIILEVSQIGKECHTACAIRNLAGDCIMPREGLFCTVVKGGVLRAGDPVKLYT